MLVANLSTTYMITEIQEKNGSKLLLKKGLCVFSEHFFVILRKKGIMLWSEQEGTTSRLEKLIWGRMASTG